MWTERTVPMPMTASPWVSSQTPSDVEPLGPNGRALPITGMSGSRTMTAGACGLSSSVSSLDTVHSSAARR